MNLMDELEKSNKEIFRFEALQEYFSDGSNEVGNEINRQWRETGEIDMNLMKKWHEFIKKKVQNGVKFIWIRLVEFPLNEYTKSGLYIYKKRLEFGIDIRIITKEKFDKLGIDVKDFYFLDGKAIVMNYGKSNEFIDCELSEDTEKYREAKELLIKNSVRVLDFKY